MDRSAPDQQTAFRLFRGWTSLERCCCGCGTFHSVYPKVHRNTTAGFDPSLRDPLDSYEEDIYCNEFSARCFVKFDVVGDLVQHIWLECRLGMSESLPLCATPC